MKGFAIHHAPTDHGGRIASTQMRSAQQGHLFVRAGDGHFCPQCKVWSTVQPSHHHVIFDGKPVAYVNDRLSCGARILAQQSHVVGESGGTNLGCSTSIVQPIRYQQNLSDQEKYKEEKEEDKKCACDREITLDDLKSLAVGSTKHLSNFITPLNETFKLYDIKTCMQKAYFISQTFLETSEYKLLEEGVNEQYEKANYGGYKGRGLIQLTLKANYIAYGQYKGEDFTGAHRTKIATPKYAVDSAAWFWRKGKSRDLNELATKNDLIGVSALINGGFNHFDHDSHGGGENRKSYLFKAFQTLNVKECKNTPPSILNSLEEFKLKNSVVNEMVGEAFGWGLWHDAEFKKIGCTKSVEEAKNGYLRFMKLAETKKFQPEKRYGYSIEKAKKIALRKLK